MLPVLMAGFLAWGFGFGGTIPIGEFVWARYFGRRYIGAVRSVGQPITILLGSIGPISLALYYDATGAYDWAFVALTASYLVGGLLILTSREPAPKEAPPAPTRAVPATPEEAPEPAAV
jgi:MFS transporter, OFA family, oxalate/formate antiporter